MQKNKGRDKALSELQQFCNNPPMGLFAYQRFNAMVNAFPLHFLLYAKDKSNFVGTKKTAKDLILNRIEADVKKILERPLTEEEMNQLDAIMNSLTELANALNIE